MGTTRQKTTNSDVVSIRFQKLGKLYHFRLGRDSDDYDLDDYVVVETRRGRQLGQIIEFVEGDDAKRRRGMRSVERKANPRDLVMQQVWQSKELEALITTRDKAHQLKLVDVKFIKATYSFDGSWVTISYTTENKQMDLRELQTALGRTLKARVEMRLIGPRDVARILGGYGACGGPRCCSTFLTEFSPVSIRMAKAQGISLSPNEITGMCGRLRCCLVFEYEQYVEAKKHLPRIKSKVGTPHGEGYVRDVRVLRDAVLVDVRGEYHEVMREDLEPLKELKALKEKAAAGCSKHEGGGCDCGSKQA
jgi:cell fate regulator YaaT (PSP1 superfamily)